MANASNFLESAVLNHFFRNTATTASSAVYLALYKTNPADGDAGTEISGGGYARQQITFGAPSQASGVSTISNNNAIAFPEATADWTTGTQTVGYWGIRTALTGGSLLAHGEFKDAGKLNDGKYPVTRYDQFNVGVGKISIQFGSKASNWLQNAVLNHFFRAVSTASPASVYLALYKTDPTSADTGTEIAYTGYARQKITFAAPAQQSGGEALITNSAVINFPIPAADIGEVSHFGIRTALSGGNLLAFAPWSAVKAISAGMQFAVNAGNLAVSMN
jgi:hypothetical protein